jgi:hypothetical protein
VASTFETLLLAQLQNLQNQVNNNTPQLIQTQTLGSTTASVTFTVPASPAYTRLSLYWRARLSAAGSQDLELQFDGDTAAHYLWAKVEASNGAAGGAHAGASPVAIIKIGVVSGDTASYFGSGRQDIEGWSNSTGFLTCTGPYANFDVAGTDWSGNASGIYLATGPHTSIKVFPAANSFVAGSTFSLYGSF